MPKLQRKKKGDRRGQHRNHAKAKHCLLRDVSVATYPSCTECGQSTNSFVPTDEGDAMVCTKCGLVLEIGMFEPSFDSIEHSSRVDISVCYQRRNYFAERMRQFTCTEPMFTLEEENDIMAVYNGYVETNREWWAAEGLCKIHFTRIFRTLAKEVPQLNYKSRLERWLQAKRLICPTTPCGSAFCAAQMKTMFDAVADVFYTHYRKQKNIKNIPKIDILCLIFLYNIGYEALRDYGWYFYSKDVALCNDNVIRAWDHYQELLHMVNRIYSQNTARRSRKETVSVQCLYLFLHKNFQFQVPSLTDIKRIVTQHKLGQSAHWFALADNHINKTWKF